MSALPDKISKLLHFMQSCICDIKTWATENMLRPHDKRELMLVISKKTKYLYDLNTLITVGNDHILFKQSVINLGFALYCYLTMNERVSNSALTCCFDLSCLESIRACNTCICFCFFKELTTVTQ